MSDSFTVYTDIMYVLLLLFCVSGRYKMFEYALLLLLLSPSVQIIIIIVIIAVYFIKTEFYARPSFLGTKLI